MKRFAALLLSLLLFAAPAQALQGPVYEVFVASFYDSGGDGVGDLRGVAQKLDYIASLHARGLWLMPIHPSPSYHKYDVTDYLAVDPGYGTLADFDALAQACRQRGLVLLLDLVINHTSSQHPWFLSACQSLAIPPCGQAACTSKPLCRAHNPYVRYYVFTQNSGRHPVAQAPGWYYHSSFGYHMPDLNLDEPLVREELRRIAAFWLAHGAGGFRLDAVIHFYEENTARNAAFLAWFNGMVRQLVPDAYLVAEAWKDQDTINALYQSGIDSLFDFALAGPGGQLVAALREGTGAQWIQQAAARNAQIMAAGPRARNAVFLSNHDMARSSGILRRDLPRQKAAAAAYLLLAGIPFVYYGEEIGLSGSGRDENKRLPMLWSAKDAAGQCLPPQGADQAQKLEAGVAEQSGDPASLLSFYRAILAVRQQLPWLTGASMTAIDAGNPAVAAARFVGQAGSHTAVLNFSAQPQQVTISWPGALRQAWDCGFGMPAAEPNGLLLPAFSGCIYY